MINAIVSPELAPHQQLMLGKNDLVKIGLLDVKWPNHLPAMEQVHSTIEGEEEVEEGEGDQPSPA